MSGCGCECNRGGFCGGCGHAGCGGRVHHVLRADVVADLVEYLRNDPVHGLEELWEVLVPGWRGDDVPRLCVTHHRLDRETGRVLAQACIDGGVAAGAGFPAGLWLNYGPATEPEPSHDCFRHGLQPTSATGREVGV